VSRNANAALLHKRYYNKAYLLADVDCAELVTNAIRGCIGFRKPDEREMQNGFTGGIPRNEILAQERFKGTLLSALRVRDRNVLPLDVSRICGESIRGCDNPPFAGGEAARYRG